MTKGKKGKVVDIRSAILSEASGYLAPALETLYNKYGVEITLTLMMYYAAKGCVGENGLTDKEKRGLIKQCSEMFKRSVITIESELQNGSEDSDN